MLPMKLSSVVSTRRGVGADHRRRALAGLGAVGQQRHPRPAVLRHQLGVGRAHHGEPDQVLGGGVDRRADVEDQRERVVLLAAPQLGRVDRGERGPPHALEQGPAPGARQHARAGVAGRDQRIALAARDQVGRDRDRGLGLGGERLGGLLVHLDERRGVVDPDAGAIVPHTGQQAPELGRVADQDDLGRGQRQRGLGGTVHDLLGSVITSHGVDDDAMHAGILPQPRTVRSRPGGPGRSRPSQKLTDGRFSGVTWTRGFRPQAPQPSVAVHAPRRNPVWRDSRLSSAPRCS